MNEWMFIFTVTKMNLHNKTYMQDNKATLAALKQVPYKRYFRVIYIMQNFIFFVYLRNSQLKTICS